MLRDKRPEPVGEVSDRPDEVLDLRPKPLVIRFPCVAVAGDIPDILFQRIYLAVQVADAPLKRRDFLLVFLRAFINPDSFPGEGFQSSCLVVGEVDAGDERQPDSAKLQNALHLVYGREFINRTSSLYLIQILKYSRRHIKHCR